MLNNIEDEPPSPRDNKIKTNSVADSVKNIALYLRFNNNSINKIEYTGGLK